MLPEKYQWILDHFEPGDGKAELLYEIARHLEESHPEGAATIYDRAYGLDPSQEEIRQARARLLDRFAVVEHGIRFRYVPGGVFLMGSEDGEPDERPQHPVWLTPYWMAETPVSWATYCALIGWEPPPAGLPRNRDESPGGFDKAAFHLYEAGKIRLQYCEDRTVRGRDWHSHSPGQMWQSGGQPRTAQELFGAPERDDPNAPWEYTTKPMVAVAWQEAEELADHLSAAPVRYTLPTEAQWEKAARGGLLGARYAWGNDPPTHDRCDFNRFDEFSIRPMTSFPHNGYGLYAVNGCVWEWTREWYDRDYYRASPRRNPPGPREGEEKVLRGGSWADCGEVCTVSYRMSRASNSWQEGRWGGNLTPTIGFRLCRTIAGAQACDSFPGG